MIIWHLCMLSDELGGEGHKFGSVAAAIDAGRAWVRERRSLGDMTASAWVWGGEMSSRSSLHPSLDPVWAMGERDDA